MRSILLFALPLLASCASTSTVAPTLMTATRFSKDDGFYVSVPHDGKFEARVYAESGLQTAHAVEAELLRHTTTVEVGSAAEGRESARTTAQARKLRYVVVPTILHWEDRATEWSGRLDKLQVRIEVVDAEAGTTLHSADLSGENSWATFGGDHPQDLLPKPLEQFFSGLFPASSAPSTSAKPAKDSAEW